MSGTALDRLDRVLVMVPWLLEHPGVSVDEVAGRFAISREDVVADLDVLGYCGLPGYGGGDLIEVTLAGDHVTIRMADYFSRPLRLSVGEALTLLLAGRVAAASGLAGDRGDLAAAVALLEDALGITDAPPVAVDLGAAGAEQVDPLRALLEQGRIVRLVYRSASKAETTTRDVEPWALVADGGAWYLQGWCRLADAPRDFRLDRIRSATPIDGTPEHPRPARLAPPAYQPRAADPEVVLDLAPAAAWVAEWVVTDSVAAAAGRIRVTFRVATLEWAARLVLRLGPDARVVAPAALSDRVSALATVIAGQYA